MTECAEYPEFFPPASAITQECGSCEQRCCNAAFECPGYCDESQIFIGVTHLVAGLMLVRFIMLARGRGLTWSSNTITVFLKTLLLCFLRITRAGLKLGLGPYWQNAETKVWDMLLFLLPVAIAFNVTLGVVQQWSGMLKNFDGDDKKKFTRIYRLVTFTRWASFIAFMAGSIFVDRVPGPPFVQKLLTTFNPLLVIVIIIGTVIPTAKTVKNTISVGGNEKLTKSAERIHRMAMKVAIVGVIGLFSIIFNQIIGNALEGTCIITSTVTIMLTLVVLSPVVWMLSRELRKSSSLPTSKTVSPPEPVGVPNGNVV